MDPGGERGEEIQLSGVLQATGPGAESRIPARTSGARAYLRAERRRDRGAGAAELGGIASGRVPAGDDQLKYGESLLDPAEFERATACLKNVDEIVVRRVRNDETGIVSFKREDGTFSRDR